MLEKRLRELRLEHQLTQQDLGEALGIDRTSYTYYERGKTSPSPASLCKLSRLYNVTVDYLLGLEERNAARLRESLPVGFAAPSDPIGALPKEERKLLMYYRVLDDDEKKKAMRAMQRRVGTHDRTEKESSAENE